ncbi:hypothetical protein D9756_006889 [Leucocoprinus leucothites]|uniref:F-box domain-containing protein n=1 Tax=Leucocoprinus leucothites TaxID=201217 RepID=A0A8H5FYQ4_9AGAR|nr:hypothetical protein D9756_006889 [Leucoagaricus leucothites]
MSSIDNIPVEILGYIFYSLVPHRSLDDPQRDIDPQYWSLSYNTITCLRLVSRHWNQVILSDSWFWSDIAIRVDLHDDPHYPYEPPLDVLQMWIDRSEGAPLHIMLELPECFGLTPRGSQGPSHHMRDEFDAREYLWEIIPLLMNCSTQWRGLSVTATVDALTTIFSLLDQVPQLQMVDLCILYDSDHDNLKGFKQLAPMLEKITFLKLLSIPGVNPVSEAHDYIYLDIPPRTLSRITELELGEAIRRPILLSVLRECSALRWTDVNSGWPVEDTTLPVQRFQLPYLETLILGLDGNIHQFFDFIELPNLSVLQVSTLYPGIDASTAMLSHIFPRVSHPLQIFIWNTLPLEVLEAFLLGDDMRLFAIPVFHAGYTRAAAPEEAEATTENARATLAHLFPNKNFAFTKDSHSFGWVDWDVYRQWGHTLPYYPRSNVVRCFQ